MPPFRAAMVKSDATPGRSRQAPDRSPKKVTAAGEASPAQSPRSPKEAASGGAAKHSTRVRKAVFANGVGGGGGGANASHPALPPSTVARAKQIFDAYDPVPGEGLPVASLQRCLEDMGIVVSENQTKDITFNLRQSALVENKNAETDRRRRDQRSGEASARTSGSVTRVTSAAAPAAVAGGSAELHLPFRLFLELLTMTFDETERTREFAAAWKLLDADGDGQLGAKDVAKAFERFRPMAGGDGSGVEDLTAPEIEMLLRDLDFDSDGAVTLDDLKQALGTS